MRAVIHTVSLVPKPARISSSLVLRGVVLFLILHVLPGGGALRANEAGPAPAAILLDDARDNVASSINTRGDERDPALTQDGRLLFFASDRSGEYRIYAAYLQELTPEGKVVTVPRLLGPRPLPQVLGLGGPGEARSPALCEKRADGTLHSVELFYRSEADWGAGLYRAEVTASLMGQGADRRLVLATARVRPILQDLGLRLEGPWIVHSRSGPLLLARAAGKFVAWSLPDCVPTPLEPARLPQELPWLSQAESTLSLATRGADEILVSGEGPNGSSDFRRIDSTPLPEALNSVEWDELEAAWGGSSEGGQLLIFSRQSGVSRQDGDLYAIWISVPTPP